LYYAQVFLVPRKSLLRKDVLKFLKIGIAIILMKQYMQLVFHSSLLPYQFLPFL